MQIARQQVDSARARALAETALSRAIYELFNSNEETRWLFNGTLYQWSLPEGEIKIMIRNTAGLVDINTATPEALDTLFSGLQIDEGTKQSLVDAILDWKDQDDLKHLNGAEDAEYKAAGLDYGTPDRNFFSIGELRYVLGMNTSIYNTVAPYITVYSGLSTINQDYASEELSALFGGSDNASLDSISNDQVLSDSEQADSNNTSLIPGNASNVFHVSIWASASNGANMGLEADVDTTQNESQSYSILSWQESSQ